MHCPLSFVFSHHLGKGLWLSLFSREITPCKSYTQQRGDGCASRFATEERTNIPRVFYSHFRMTKLTYSDSPFFSNWSQSYFTNLTLDQHIVNNNWFMDTLTMLRDDGVLYVPTLNKSFNRMGKEVTV